MIWIIWIVLAVVLLIIEIITTELVVIWFSVSAFVSALINVFFPELHIVWQIVIFVLLSTILLVCTRPLVKKLLKKRNNQETNLDLILNHVGLVVSEIDNDREVGEVKINGLIWNARSETGEIIPKDTLVIILEIQGNKLKVKRKNNE